MSGKRVRIAYVMMAIVAFALSLAVGDAPFIAMSGFILLVALLGAFIATRQERQEG
jgi:hypothetical protein